MEGNFGGGGGWEMMRGQREGYRACWFAQRCRNVLWRTRCLEVSRKRIVLDQPSSKRWLCLRARCLKRDVTSMELMAGCTTESHNSRQMRLDLNNHRLPSATEASKSRNLYRLRSEQTSIHERKAREKLAKPLQHIVSRNISSQPRISHILQ